MWNRNMCLNEMKLCPSWCGKKDWVMWLNPKLPCDWWRWRLSFWDLFYHFVVLFYVFWVHNIVNIYMGIGTVGSYIILLFWFFSFSNLCWCPYYYTENEGRSKIWKNHRLMEVNYLIDPCFLCSFSFGLH